MISRSVSLAAVMWRCPRFGIVTPAAAQGTIETIALGGQPAPGGAGTLSGFDPPLLNNAGQIAFVSQLEGDTRAIDVYDPDDSAGDSRLWEIARQRQSIWGGELVFTTFTTMKLSVEDRLAFAAAVRRYGRSSSEGLYLASGPAAFSLLNELVRPGDTPEGGASQNYESFGLKGLAGSEGQFTRVLFTATLHADPPTAGGTGLFFIPNAIMADGSRTLVREGREAPGGGTFANLFAQDARMNAADLVAFSAPLRDTGATSDDSGIYTIDARRMSATPSLVAREGQAVTGGGTFGDFNSSRVELNGAGADRIHGRDPVPRPTGR